MSENKPDKIWIDDTKERQDWYLAYPNEREDCPAEYTRTALLSDPAYLASVDGWISVEDRLPEEAELMEKPEELEWLVFDGVKVSTTANHPANWNYDFELGIDTIREVTHWRPLPSPPPRRKTDE